MFRFKTRPIRDLTEDEINCIRALSALGGEVGEADPLAAEYARQLDDLLRLGIVTDMRLMATTWSLTKRGRELAARLV